MRLLARLLLPASLASLVACGPARSTSALMDADAQLEAARAAGARTGAVYEYTAAEVYLHKAREAQGQARYEASTRFALRAAELGRAARAKAGASTVREAP